MEKMREDYSKETVNLYANIIEPRSFAARVPAEARRSSLSSLELPRAQWEPVIGQLPDEQEPEALCFRRMSEFAKRIDESAANSSVWVRLNGKELSGLRLSFRNLLRQLLEELDASAATRCQEYAAICQSGKNGDIVLAYRLAYLLSVSAPSRVEVGIRSGCTEFNCFLSEWSAGVSIRRDDNLFALCTNGEWRGGMHADVPPLAIARQAVEKHGGQLLMDPVDGAAVKVRFAA